jgi:hypothetical protein
MTFAKRWKTNWELKSLSQKDLFDVIVIGVKVWLLVQTISLIKYGVWLLTIII